MDWLFRYDQLLNNIQNHCPSSLRCKEHNSAVRWFAVNYESLDAHFGTKRANTLGVSSFFIILSSMSVGNICIFLTFKLCINYSERGALFMVC